MYSSWSQFFDIVRRKIRKNIRVYNKCTVYIIPESFGWLRNEPVTVLISRDS